MLRRLSKRREVSSVVAITPDGRLYARHFRTSVSSRTVILALRYFRRQIGTPLLVIWDRLNAHRSRATTGFIAAHAQDYAVAYLPAYAPELNPEEQCNAFVKRALANALPDSVADLHRLARREFVRLQSRPKMIVSFFGTQASPLQPSVKILRTTSASTGSITDPHLDNDRCGSA